MTIEKPPFPLPPRAADGNKGTFGHVMVIGGCKNYLGAPILSGKAAYRSGCGLVEMVVPEIVRNCCAAAFPEAIWNCEKFISDPLSVNEKKTLILGPGLGTRPDVQTRVHAFVREAAGKTPHILIDADALNCLALRSDWAGELPIGCVLTPHPGEMSRLCGLSIRQIQENRQQTAEHFAEIWNQTVLLKGAHTVISAPGHESLTLPFASSALAVAGSGDVLSGVIGGLMAQGMPPFEAACLGAWLHGQCGLMAAQTLGSDYAVLASDILNALAQVIASLVTDEK